MNRITKIASYILGVSFLFAGLIIVEQEVLNISQEYLTSSIFPTFLLLTYFLTKKGTIKKALPIGLLYGTSFMLTAFVTAVLNGQQQLSLFSFFFERPLQTIANFPIETWLYLGSFFVTGLLIAFIGYYTAVYTRSKKTSVAAVLVMVFLLLSSVLYSYGYSQSTYNRPELSDHPQIRVAQEVFYKYRPELNLVVELSDDRPMTWQDHGVSFPVYNTQTVELRYPCQDNYIEDYTIENVTLDDFMWGDNVRFHEFTRTLLDPIDETLITQGMSLHEEGSDDVSSHIDPDNPENSSRSYFVAYKDNSTYCVFRSDPTCSSSYSRKDTYTKTLYSGQFYSHVSFSCSDAVEESFAEIEPFVEDLGFNNGQTYIALRAMDGDYARLAVSNTKMLVKNVNGTWSKISQSQDLYPCVQLKEWGVPNTVEPECYANAEEWTDPVENPVGSPSEN